MNPVHIVTDKENIAERVLMPGDPLRAKYIAENFLDDAKCINTVRNMLGFTGYYKGTKLTVIGSGMGIPSMGIYSYELAKFYDVKKIIRIGSAGSLNKAVKVNDLVLASSSKSLSTFGYSFSQDTSNVEYASSELIDIIKSKITNETVHVGQILTSDIFDVYSDITPTLEKLDFYDPIAVEMEAYALYHIARITNIEAACIVTVVDSKYEVGKELTTLEREKSLDDMIKLSLEAIIA